MADKNDDIALETEKQEKSTSGALITLDDYRAPPANDLREFLEFVFPYDLGTDENILTCVKPPKGRYFTARSETYAMQKAPDGDKALYFSTSTFGIDPDDGKLYHRRSHFKALHVLVLDDIGTKVPESKIPPAFLPSYKIETSEGNYQWGYRLTDPIENYEAASALIKMVYESGASDEGGKMPNKWVRLPQSVNGKEGNPFVSRITEYNDVAYSPQEIIDHLELNADWGAVTKDASAAMKARGGAKSGTSFWSPIAPAISTANGYIDPVLEWLHEQDMVKEDSGREWVDIRCPWAAAHTDDKDVAGYAPLGRGDDPNRRGFKCFHAHCAHQKTPDFLDYVVGNNGPEASVHDPSAEMVERFAYDVMNDTVTDMHNPDRAAARPFKNFSKMYPKKIRIQDPSSNKGYRVVPLVNMWVSSPAKVTCDGYKFDPSTSARIVEDLGNLKFNKYQPPAWGIGTVTERHVKKFTDFLEYLIPSTADREFFLNTMAAKVQDPTFRGLAMVMVGHMQGLGRSTLVDMLRTLLGVHNTVTVELDTLIKPNNFNEHMAALLTVVEETKTPEKDEYYGSYERLKTFVDPRAVEVTINPKYGQKYTALACSMSIFLTNHSEAIPIPAEDRRFYVMENARERKPPEYFGRLYAWIAEEDFDGHPAWARAVYRWLMKREVDPVDLVAPPERTRKKDDMIMASMSQLDFVFNAVIAAWPCPYISMLDIRKILNRPEIQTLVNYDPIRHNSHIRNLMQKHSEAYTGVQILIGGEKHNPRVLKSYMEAKHAPLPEHKKEYDKTRIIKEFKTRPVNINDVGDEVMDAIRAADRD